MTCNCVRPAGAGDPLIASQGGSDKTSFRKGRKCLKRMNVGSVASIASMIGAAKLGASIALTDCAKQNAVIVSIVKHRRAKKRSEDTPFSLLRARTVARWSI